MNKRKGLLIILCIILIVAYYKLFYKTYNVNTVVKSADVIIDIDVKRVTNTILWGLLKHPGQWNFSRSSSTQTNEVDWKDMVKIPDHIFIFHVKNQPQGIWYTVLPIKDAAIFSKGILQYGFIIIDSADNKQIFASAKWGASFVQAENRILLTNASAENIKEIKFTGTEIFSDKNYISKQALKKNINAGSHISIIINKNKFLEEDGIVKINFDEDKINIDALLVPEKQFSFTEQNFSYNDSNLLSLNFSQPCAPLYNLFSDNSKTVLSPYLNFNIDSLLLQSNKKYSLSVTGILPRVDSAISYSYDDNFNPIKKVVVNNIEEPSFNFSLTGAVPKSIFDYYNNNQKLEKSSGGYLFTPLPFVKSFCTANTDSTLNITSINYEPSKIDKSITAVLFLNFVLTKIPSSLLHYLPENLINKIENISSINILVQKNDGGIKIKSVVFKKKNNLPLLKL